MDAGLTARELAGRADWHESKCSRLENGRTPPSDADVRTYTRLCAAQDQTADLIATARGIEGAYVQWRRMERAGLRRVQQSVAPLFERTRRFRVCQSWVIPGLLQSAAYTRAVLSTVAQFRDVSDSADIDDAVGVRLERQRILCTPVTIGSRCSWRSGCCARSSATTTPWPGH